MEGRTAYRQSFGHVLNITWPQDWWSSPWWIHCHDSRATCHIAGCSHLAKSMSWSCHIAGCKNSIRHIEKSFFAIFYVFFGFFNAVWALTSGGFRIVSDRLVLNCMRQRHCAMTLVFTHYQVYSLNQKTYTRPKGSRLMPPPDSQIYLQPPAQGRRCHRSWGSWPPTFRGKEGRGT